MKLSRLAMQPYFFLGGGGGGEEEGNVQGGVRLCHEPKECLYTGG